jgi:protein-tyrosine phosphatase
MDLPPPHDGLPYRIVFVCTGNICRSPMAEIITRTMAEHTEVGGGPSMGAHLELSSAGTGPWHEGEPMHPNTASALTRGGFGPDGHIAHQFPTSRLAQFDLIVSLDRRHQQTLRGLGADPERLRLLRTFDGSSGAAADVPDPYYGDATVFDDCREMITVACAGLVASLAANWVNLTGERQVE